MKIIFYLITSLALLASCLFNSSGCKIKGLSKDEKKYLDNIDNYSELIYSITKNDTLADSTIKVNCEKVEYFVTTCNKFELGPEQFESGIIAYRLPSWVLKYLSYKDFSVSFSHDNNSTKICVKNLSLGDLYAQDLTDFDSLPEIKIFSPIAQDSIKVYEIDQVYCDGPIGRGSYFIQAAYWSNKYGLVRIKKSNGTVFDLIERKR